jgi:hypothetical protein
MRGSLAIASDLCPASSAWADVTAMIIPKMCVFRAQVRACWLGHAIAAAKRAVLLCGKVGQTLPVEKFEQWGDIELTFCPERTNSE